MAGIDANTKLMLHCNSLADASTSGHTVTANGGAATSTTQSKFGGTSLKFTATSAHWYSVPSHADFNFGSGDFTIDWWAYEISGTLPITSIAREATATYPPFILNYNSSIWMSSNGTFWDIAAGCTFGTPVYNSWQHFEISRQGNTFRTFRNGVQQDTWTSSLAFPSNSNPLSIGKCQNGGSYMNGYMDEIRVSKGVCRHTANFTPETAEYTAPSISLIAPSVSGNIVAVATASNDAYIDLVDPSGTPSGRYEIEWAHVVSDFETPPNAATGAALTCFVSSTGGAPFHTGPNYHNTGQSIFTGETNAAYLCSRVSGGIPQGISALELQALTYGMRLSIDSGDFPEYGSNGTATIMNRGGHTTYTSLSYKGAGGGNAGAAKASILGGGTWFGADSPQYFHWPIPVMYAGHFDGALGQQPNAFRLTMGGAGSGTALIESGVFILRRLD